MASSVAVAVGILTWAGAALATNRRETWESDLYFTIVLPVVGVCAFVLGVVIPERAWRRAIAPFAGQAATAMVFALFGAAACVSAFLGAAIGRRLRGSSPG